MITCEHCELLINARLDECLTQEEAVLLDEHLAHCPDCQKLDRDLTALHEQLLALASHLPERLIPSILSELEVPPMETANKKKKKAPWAAIACAVAAAALLLVVVSPQMSPFGGSADDTAAAESASTAEGSEFATDTAPAEGATQEESQPESMQTEPLTEKKALKYLDEYLDMVGYSLTVSDGMLAEDGSFWTFSGRSEDSSERFLFNVYCSDGYVEEVLLP